MATVPFPDVALESIRSALESRHETVLALDPGETTGVAVLCGGNVLLADEHPTPEVGPAGLYVLDLINAHHPDVVVMEEYRVYAWRIKEHAWASLHTPRLIGAIEYICYFRRIPLVKQMAQMPKGFWTDDKLRRIGAYFAGTPHARDAIRHGLYYILFELAKIHKPT